MHKLMSVGSEVLYFKRDFVSLKDLYDLFYALSIRSYRVFIGIQELTRLTAQALLRFLALDELNELKKVIVSLVREKVIAERIVGVLSNFRLVGADPVIHILFVLDSLIIASEGYQA